MFFFHAFSGLLRVILTSVGYAVCNLREYLELKAQESSSAFY
jgi:hypothetical protein